MAQQDEWKAGSTIPFRYSLRGAGSGRMSMGAHPQCDDRGAWPMHHCHISFTTIALTFPVQLVSCIIIWGL